MPNQLIEPKWCAVEGTYIAKVGKAKILGENRASFQRAVTHHLKGTNKLVSIMYPNGTARTLSVGISPHHV